MTTPIEKDIIASYLLQRRFLGIIGILLPFAVAIGLYIKNNQCFILPSISDYYHTHVSNIFVCFVFAIAVFLWAHSGNVKHEKSICKLAAICAATIAFVPTPLLENIVHEQSHLTIADFQQCYIPSIANPSYFGYIHYTSAAIFFLLIAYLVYFIFVESEKNSPKANQTRIRAYKICGLGMFISIVIIAVFNFLLKDYFPNSDNWIFPPTYTFETISLLLFGTAWLIKGHFIFDETQGFLRVK